MQFECEKIVILVLHSTLRYHVSLGVPLALPDLLFFCNGILWSCYQNSTFPLRFGYKAGSWKQLLEEVACCPLKPAIHRRRVSTAALLPRLVITW